MDIFSPSSARAWVTGAHGDCCRRGSPCAKDSSKPVNPARPGTLSAHPDAANCRIAILVLQDTTPRPVHIASPSGAGAGLGPVCDTGGRR